MPSDAKERKDSAMANRCGGVGEEIRELTGKILPGLSSAANMTPVLVSDLFLTASGVGSEFPTTNWR